MRYQVIHKKTGAVLASCKRMLDAVDLCRSANIGSNEAKERGNNDR